MKTSLYFLILMVILVSCSNDIHTITIFPSTSSDSFFEIKVIEKIPLETNESSILGSIDDFKYSDDGLIIFDKTSTNSLLFFNSKGSFLSRSKKGKGPGELINPQSFTVKEELVYIIDSRFIKCYDTKGIFISMKQIPDGLYTHGFEFLSDNLIFTYGSSLPLNYTNSNKTYLFHSLSSDLKEYYNPFLESRIELMGLEGRNPLSVFNNRGILVGRPSDYIFESNGYELRKKYFIDFEEKAFVENDIKKGQGHLIDLIRKETRLGMLDNVRESDDFLSFSYLKRGGQFLEEVFVIYSKRINMSCKSSELFSNNGFPNMRIQELIGNKLFCSVNPSDLDEKTISSLIESGLFPSVISSDSNPIIFVFELSVNQ